MNQTSLTDLLIQAVNFLPSLAIIILLAYFYAQKKIPGLLLMLIAYIIILLVLAFNIYGVKYFYARNYTAQEIQQVYSRVGIISILAHVLLMVGLGIVLSRYPNSDKYKQDSFL